MCNNPQIGLKRRKAPSKADEKEKPAKTKEDGTQIVKPDKSPKEWFRSLDEADYKLMDLFHVLTANNSTRGKVEGEEGEVFFSDQVLELAMLSTLLVFKDICPEQRIRPEAERQSLQVSVCVCAYIYMFYEYSSVSLHIPYLTLPSIPSTILSTTL